MLETRDVLGRLLRGDDDRIVVVVGPCSIHDTDLALEYAGECLLVGTFTEDRFLHTAFSKDDLFFIGW